MNVLNVKKKRNTQAFYLATISRLLTYTHTQSAFKKKKRRPRLISGKSLCTFCYNIWWSPRCTKRCAGERESNPWQKNNLKTHPHAADRFQKQVDDVFRVFVVVRTFSFPVPTSTQDRKFHLAIGTRWIILRKWIPKKRDFIMMLVNQIDYTDDIFGVAKRKITKRRKKYSILIVFSARAHT